jgi:hypothetical protein
MDPDPASAIFVIDLQEANIKLIFFKFGFSAYYFLRGYLHHFSKIKSHKRSYKTVGSMVFLTIVA